jgi:glycosyltransferase involved in cell wall biosynthesis
VKILFISSNKRFFELHSNERGRLKEMSEVAEAVHAIIITLKKDALKIERVDDHTWLYPTNSRFFFLSMWDAWWIVRSQVYWKWKLRADAVISDDPEIAGRTGTLISRWYKKRWIVNIFQNFWTPGAAAKSPLRNGFGLLSKKYLLRHADTLCVFSSTAEKALVKEVAAGLIPYAKILSFTTIVDVEGLRNTPIDVSLRLRYPKYHFILLTVFERPSEAKINLVLETLAYLHERRYREAGLIIISPKDLGASFDQKVSKLGLSKWVKVEREDNDLVSYLKSTNIYLNLSSLEDNEERYVFMKAAAAGCPIISIDSLLAREVIEDGENGLLIKEPKPELFFVGIVKMNETAGLREQFKLGSDKLIVHKFAKSQEELKAKLIEAWLGPANKIDQLMSIDKLIS